MEHTLTWDARLVSPTWPVFWSGVAAALRKRGYRTSTLKFYRQVIRDFSRQCGKSPDRVKPEDIRGYIRSVGEKACSWHWTAMNISVLRMVFDKLGRMQALRDVRGPRRRRQLPEHLTHDEVRRLLAHGVSVRDQLIIALLYGCGLKVSELQAMRWEDIDLANGVLRLKSRYHDGIRRLALPVAVVPVLKAGISRCERGDRVFPGRRSSRALSARSIELIVRDCAVRAGIDKPVCPMILRHTFAIHSLIAGMNIRQLQEQMDHIHLDATMRYADCLPIGFVGPLDLCRPSAETPAETVQPGTVDFVYTERAFPMVDSGASFVGRLRTSIASAFGTMTRRTLRR